MKREKFILQPGKICTFDTKNLLKKNDINGVVIVEILEELPKKKLFGPRWFKIIGIDGDKNKLDKPVNVPETLLSPIGMCVIRNPSNFPAVNTLDVQVLDYVIKSLTNPTDMIVMNNTQINRLKALKEKLKFYIELTEV